MTKFLAATVAALLLVTPINAKELQFPVCDSLTDSFVQFVQAEFYGDYVARAKEAGRVDNFAMLLSLQGDITSVNLSMTMQQWFIDAAESWQNEMNQFMSDTQASVDAGLTQFTSEADAKQYAVGNYEQITGKYAHILHSNCVGYGSAGGMTTLLMMSLQGF